MRGEWIGLTLGALTIVTGSLARADDVGCCEAQCHISDDSGAVGGTVAKGDMTRAECESRFSECDTTWQPDACGGAAGIGGVRRGPDTEER
jgi:hypothetical protein